MKILILVPSNVILRVKRDEVAITQMEPLPSNDELIWVVTVPSSSAGRELRQMGLELMAIVMVALRHASVMDTVSWDALVQARMERGLPGRALIVRPPEEMLAMVQPALPDNLKLIEAPEFSPPFRLFTSPELQQPQLPGPMYDSEKACARITDRYRVGVNSIALTLPRLLEDQRTRAVILDLLKAEWLDWQVLLILSNVVAQWQVETVHGRATSNEELSRLFRASYERLNRREQEDDPVFDLSALNSQAISGQCKSLILLALKQWGLESHRETPDFNAIKGMLSQRYAFGSDDVEHADPFAGIRGQKTDELPDS